MVLFELSEFLWTFTFRIIDSLSHEKTYSPFALVLSYFHLSVKLYHTFVCIPFSFGKTKLSLRLFVLFCSFSTQIFLLFDCQRSLQTCVCWSVWMDSNHRPRAYQARALTTWATDRYSLIGSLVHPSFDLLGIWTFNPNKFESWVSHNRAFQRFFDPKA